MTALERVFVNPIQNYVAKAGKWEPYDSGSGWFLINGSNAINDEVGWTVGLEAATWKFTTEWMGDEECCEGKFYLDGTEIGALNQYEAGEANGTGRQKTFSGIVVGTAGKHTLSLKVVKKGSATDNYYVVGYSCFHQ